MTTTAPTPLRADHPALVNAVLVRVPAGFPSPAQDSFDDGRIDLNEVLIRDVTSTFVLRVTVIAVVDGHFTIKRLQVHPDRVVLHPENESYPDVEVPALSELVVWGVVTFGLRHLNQRK